VETAAARAAVIGTGVAVVTVEGHVAGADARVAQISGRARVPVITEAGLGVVEAAPGAVTGVDGTWVVVGAIDGHANAHTVFTVVCGGA
jgi:hypothetical protein